MATFKHWHTEQIELYSFYTTAFKPFSLTSLTERVNFNFTKTINRVGDSNPGPTLLFLQFPPTNWPSLPAPTAAAPTRPADGSGSAMTTSRPSRRSRTWSSTTASAARPSGPSTSTTSTTSAARDPTLSSTRPPKSWGVKQIFWSDWSLWQLRAELVLSLKS